MNILYASDNNFSKVLGVSLYSLLLNNKNINNIFVISQNISDNNKEKLNNIANRFNTRLVFIEMPNFDQILGTKTDIKRYSLSMFSRIIITTLLPIEINRVIYLDCDTLINNDLSDLYNYNLENKTIGAVNDYRSIFYQRNLNIKDSNCYINSGVLLIDLKLYRINNCENRLIDCIKKYNGIFEFPDNDAICKVMQDEILLLPIKYNMTSVFYMTTIKELKMLRKPNVIDNDNVIEVSKRNPSIIHFTTMFLMNGRPWYKDCNHPYSKKYLDIYKLTPWKDEELSVFKMSFVKRIKKIITCIIPRFILIPVIGIIHSYIKPFFQSFKYRNIK